MKDPEYAAWQQEVRDAEQRAQAARLRLWEKRGPDWRRRLAMSLVSLSLGFATGLSIWLFLGNLEMAQSYGVGFPGIDILRLATCFGILLFLRFTPQLRPFTRHFNTELILGFPVGLVLTLLLWPRS